MDFSNFAEVKMGSSDIDDTEPLFDLGAITVCSGKIIRSNPRADGYRVRMISASGSRQDPILDIVSPGIPPFLVCNRKIVLLSTGDFVTLSIHSLDTGHQHVKPLIANPKPLRSFAITDKYLVCSHEKNSILTVLDLRVGEQWSLSGHKESVRVLEIDGSVLCSCGWDGQLKVWDMKSRQNLTSFEMPDHKLSGLYLQKDLLAFAGNNGKKSHFEFYSRQGAEFELLSSSIIQPRDELPKGENIAFKENDVYLSSGERIVHIDILGNEKNSINTGELIRSLFLFDDFLYVGYQSGKIGLYDLHLNFQAIHKCHNDEVTSIICHEQLFITSGWGGKIKIWDDKWNLIQTLQYHKARVWSVSIVKLSKRNWLTSVSSDGRIVFWDTATFSPVLEYMEYGDSFYFGLCDPQNEQWCWTNNTDLLEVFVLDNDGKREELLLPGNQDRAEHLEIYNVTVRA